MTVDKLKIKKNVPSRFIDLEICILSISYYYIRRGKAVFWYLYIMRGKYPKGIISYKG